MSSALMTHSQQSDSPFADQAAWNWHLTEGSALRLDAENRVRWLLVTEGRVWLTLSADGPDQVPQDCWLEAGDSVQLPADQDAVLESWPSARFELLQAAPAEAVNASVALKPSASLRRWLQALRLPTPVAPATCAG